MKGPHTGQAYSMKSKARGCNDILIAVTDGLKGMTKAIENRIPKDDTSDLYCAFAEKFNGFCLL